MLETRVEHHLDLPALYTRPPFDVLNDTLLALELGPTSWDAADEDNQLKAHSAGYTSYLTSLVSSSLGWLRTEAEREAVWELASRRLSERSGRSARGGFSRSFRIPAGAKDVEISLYEPGLTGDDLGHKTWGASYVLARKLHEILPQMPSFGRTTSLLELGSGTGLAGLAAAAVWSSSRCVLTDLDAIVPNLARNIGLNEDVVHSNVEPAVLDWSDLASSSLFGQTFQIVLSSDGLYGATHPGLLSNAIFACMERGRDARLILALPIREGYAALRDEFLLLISQKMECLHSQTDEGREDWGAGSVMVCWSIWAWTGDNLV